MAVLSFDQLNVLYEGRYKRKSIPYEEYFGEMGLDEKQKEERVDFSNRFEEIMLFLFYLINAYEEYGMLENNLQQIISQTEEKYKQLAEEYSDLDEYVEDYIRDFARQIVETTKENMDKPYFLSEDRAVLVAENEANSILNYTEYLTAVEKGYTKKKWNTEMDKDVRKTHRKVESVVMDITEPYFVGDSLMLFPKDTSYGASAEEIVNCRCTIEYIK